jgi:hypothetical protein
VLSFSQWSPCFRYITWAPDESALAAQVQEGAGQRRALYIWRVDGSAPLRVVDTPNYGFAAWSLDAKRLAVIRDISAGGQTEFVLIVDAQGERVSEFEMERTSDLLGFGWLTDDVLVKSMWRGTLAYYRASTGQHLFTWVNSPQGGTPLQQYPTLSPDRRWVTLDQGRFDYNHLGRARKRYSLFDLQNDTELTLMDSPGNYLAYAGWNEDSTILYVISRPGDTTSVAELHIPYGLLAFDPATREFRPLLKDAVRLGWSPDRTWAYVLFAARGLSDTLGLAGGFWQAGMESVVGQQFVADEMVYQDPAHDPMPASEMLIVSLAWSHDGQQAIYSNAEAQVYLFSVDGTTERMAEALPCASWRALQFTWSHDDRRVLVACGERAWIANLRP